MAEPVSSKRIDDKADNWIIDSTQIDNLFVFSTGSCAGQFRKARKCQRSLFINKIFAEIYAKMPFRLLTFTKAKCL